MKSFKAYYPEHKVLEEKNWAKMALSLMGAGLAAAHGQQAYSNHTPAYSQPATTTALKVSDNEIAAKLSTLFDLRPAVLIKRLGLKNPIYSETAAYGHMGRTPEMKTVGANGHTRQVETFTWEKLDYVDKIKQAFGL